MKRVIILQSKDDCLFYKKNFFNIEDTFISIGPDSVFFCKENNLNYLSLSNLCTDQEHDIKKIESDDLISQCIKNLNIFSSEKYRKYELEIGSYFGFQLKIILGQVMHNSFIAKKILKKFNDSKIFVFKSKKTNFFMNRNN